MTNDVFLLHCSVSAVVRQSTQIKFDDLKLPQQTIDTLLNQQAVSVRPNLSGKLKEHLNKLRAEQRKLYDECTIHKGDVHFLHAEHFDDAMQRIARIRSMADECNEDLRQMWSAEYEKWAVTVEGFLKPLFSDESEFRLAQEAYLRMFPTREQFHSPIRVFVVGPNPCLLEEVENADNRIAQASAINTMEVLEAARAGAADRALAKAAELLDDLDVRNASKVGDRQTGAGKRRGSWEVIADQLSLITKHCPGFDNLAALSDRLLATGAALSSPLNTDKQKAYEDYNNVRQDIRDELERIVNQRDSTEGLETLKKSLALTGTYRDLIGRISDADTVEELENLHVNIETETDVYAQRAKQLQRLYAQRLEFVRASNLSTEELTQQVEEMEVATTEDCDF